MCNTLTTLRFNRETGNCYIVLYVVRFSSLPLRAPKERIMWLLLKMTSSISLLLKLPIKNGFTGHIAAQVGRAIGVSSYV